MEEVKLTLAISITLYNALGKILEYSDEKGHRIPANVKYKLLRSRGLMEKDFAYYEQKRIDSVKKYGKAEADGNVKVTDENVKAFRDELLGIVQTEVRHKFDKISVEDMDYVKADNLSAEELSLIMAFLIDDPSLIEDLKTPINDDKESDTSKAEETPNKE